MHVDVHVGNGGFSLDILGTWHCQRVSGCATSGPESCVLG